MSNPRLVDPRTYPIEFTRSFLVRCPACGERARVGYSEDPRYRLTCSTCSFTRDWGRDPRGAFRIPLSGPRLAALDLDLWLQVPCCGHTLWAFNVEHLELIDAFARAKLRSRSRHEQFGWANGSVTSRLPKWLKSAKNRSRVSSALDRLHRLAGTRKAR